MSKRRWTFAGLAALAIVPPAPAALDRAQAWSAVPVARTTAPHVFGTIALPLRATRFDDRWRRVLHSRADPGQLTSLLGTARRAPQVQQLSLVNASLNERIRYRHDIHPSGDHWSTARETLDRSAGDCEDYVIAKLQTLRMLGVPERDLFMTIGHDGRAGAVHAVLVARVRDQFFVLDNRVNELIPHQQYRGFYPIITFGSGSSWLHGYERGKIPAAVKAMSLVLQSGRDLPLGNSRWSTAISAPGR